MVADENEKSYVHVQPIRSTRDIVTLRYGFGVFSGDFRQMNVVEAVDKQGPDSFYQVNFKCN